MDNNYELLGLSSDATVDEINHAYRIASKLYKSSGQSDAFRRLEQAYKACLQDKQSNLRLHNPQSQPQLPSNRSKPGQDKPEHTDLNDGFVYNVNDINFQERTRDNYLRERSDVTRMAESIPKIFNEQGIDRNVFNRLFEARKNKEAEISEPEPIACLTDMPYSDINLKHSANISSLQEADYNVYQDLTVNPDRVNLNEYQNTEDVTKVGKLSQADLKRRLNTRQQDKLIFNTDPLNTNPDIDIRTGRPILDNIQSSQPSHQVLPQPISSKSDRSRGSTMDFDKLKDLRKTSEQLRHEIQINQFQTHMPMREQQILQESRLPPYIYQEHPVQQLQPLQPLQQIYAGQGYQSSYQPYPVPQGIPQVIQNQPHQIHQQYYHQQPQQPQYYQQVQQLQPLQPLQPAYQPLPPTLPQTLPVRIQSNINPEFVHNQVLTDKYLQQEQNKQLLRGSVQAGTEVDILRDELSKTKALVAKQQKLLKKLEKKRE